MNDYTKQKNNRSCMICKTLLYPYSELKVSKHHVNYIDNIYIKVCNTCHLSLHHGVLFKHRFGVANVKWKCNKCGLIRIGAPCICSQELIPGHNGRLHDEQRISKIRIDFNKRRD